MPTEQSAGATDTAELDAYLTEHLFGWTPTEGGAWRCSEGTCTYPDARYVAHNGGVTIHRKTPALSTTGDGMLAVLEAMQGREWQAMTQLYPYDSLRHAAFVPEKTSIDTKDWTSADTLPLAVALAARQAIEAKE